MDGWNWVQMCDRLVGLFRACMGALGADDLDCFSALSDERDALFAELLSALEVHRPEDTALEAIYGVLVVSQAMESALVGATQRVRAELAEVRRGRVALEGYAMPVGACRFVDESR